MFVYMVTVRVKKNKLFEKVLFVASKTTGKRSSEIKKVCLRFANENGWSDLKILFYDRLGKLIQ